MTNKPKWIKDIKVLVWDLDGTLYHEIPEATRGIHKNAVKAISKAKKLSLTKAEELFWKGYEKLNSSTQVLIYSGVDRDYALSGEWYSKVQLKYLKKDERLSDVFEKLNNFRHIINTNGAMTATAKKLKRLGLNLNIFEKIFTNADMFGKLKPDMTPFRAVLNYTKLEPKKHLFLGDREKTDLVPAQKAGMRTCLVWGESKIADVSLETVYDVVKLWA